MSISRALGRVGDSQWHDAALNLWFCNTPEHGLQFQPGYASQAPDDHFWADCPHGLRKRALKECPFETVFFSQSQP